MTQEALITTCARGDEMNDDERQMLKETHEITMEMHRALMKPPHTGEPALIKRIGVVVVAVERSNWAVKWGARSFLTLGAIAGAWITLKTSLFK